MTGWWSPSRSRTCRACGTRSPSPQRSSCGRAGSWSTRRSGRRHSRRQPKELSHDPLCHIDVPGGPLRLVHRDPGHAALRRGRVRRGAPGRGRGQGGRDPHPDPHRPDPRADPLLRVPPAAEHVSRGRVPGAGRSAPPGRRATGEPTRVMTALDDAAATDAQVERFRTVRGRLERAVLPVAQSLDGRRFTWQASLDGDRAGVGGYVALDVDGRPALGQILDVELAEVGVAELGEGSAMRSNVAIRLVRGSGRLLEAGLAPFHDAPLRRARADEVRAWRTRAEGDAPSLPIGELNAAPGVPAAVEAKGFGRHTFLCGQSGSGKTYALGVILDRLLVGTRLRVIVLDPNSDFVGLGEVRDGVDQELAARHRAIAPGIVVRRPETLADLGAPGTESARRLAQRAANLGIDRLGVWSRGDAGSVLDGLARPDVRCLVVDLGSLPTRLEQALVAEAVLAALWRARHPQGPGAIRVDRGHQRRPPPPPGG